MKNYTNLTVKTTDYAHIDFHSKKMGLPKTRIITLCMKEFNENHSISPERFWEETLAPFKKINLGKKKVKSEDLNIENAYL